MGTGSKFIQWRTTNGDSIYSDGTTVTPMSQALIVRFPFGGYVWNRPVAVQVEDNDGLQRLRIVDITLLVQIVIFAIGFLITMLIWLIGNKHHK